MVNRASEAKTEGPKPAAPSLPNRAQSLQSRGWKKVQLDLRRNSNLRGMPMKQPQEKPVKSADAQPAAKFVKPTPKRTATKPAASKAPTARMTLAEVMQILEAAGSEQTRKTYARHGATGPMFGVRFGDLFPLMKKIDVDQPLARELWATGNVDARNLAMKIADPKEIGPEELDRWAIENSMRMCDLYIATLAAESPHGPSKLREWLGSSDQRLLATGWTLLGRLSDLDESFPEKELLRHIAEIEKTIHSAPNDVRNNMNRALIAIGGHSATMRTAVIAAAKRIGTVTVDHGDTACKTADAVETVEKMWARSGTRFPSPAAHERSMKSMRCRC